MTHRIVLLTLFVLAAGTPCAFAQETPAALVKKLASGSYTEREKAARALEKLGKAALPALVDATAHADLETRRRVGLLIERIDDNLAIEQVLTATPISLRFKDEPLGAALREASEHMGLPLGLQTSDKQTVDVDTGLAPYWQAWQRFCKAGKLTETDWSASASIPRHVEGGPEHVQFSKRDVEQDVLLSRLLRFGMHPIDFAAEAGTSWAEDNRSSVRVRVKWRGMDKSVAGQDASAVFAVEFRAEPRLEIATVPKVEITRIVDADGKERIVRATQLFAPQAGPREALMMGVVAGEIQFSGMLHMKAIQWPEPVRPLKELHGKIRFEAQARLPLLEVSNVLKAQGKKVEGLDGITLQVLEADVVEVATVTEKRVIRIRLVLDRIDSLTPTLDADKVVRVRPGLVAYRSAIDVAIERLKLRDAKGWRHHPLANSQYREVEKGRYEVTMLVAAPPGRVEDFGLVVEKAARNVTVEMPFVVRDVAAPK